MLTGSISLFLTRSLSHLFIRLLLPLTQIRFTCCVQSSRNCNFSFMYSSLKSGVCHKSLLIVSAFLMFTITTTIVVVVVYIIRCFYRASRLLLHYTSLIVALHTTIPFWFDQIRACGICARVQKYILYKWVGYPLMQMVPFGIESSSNK